MILYILLGLVIGVVVTLVAIHFYNDGNLVIYIPDMDDEPPYMSSEWKIPVNNIMRKKNVKLKVAIRHLNSHK